MTQSLKNGIKEQKEKPKKKKKTYIYENMIYDRMALQSIVNNNVTIIIAIMLLKRNAFSYRKQF